MSSSEKRKEKRKEEKCDMSTEIALLDKYFQDIALLVQIYIEIK